ncbi:MAG TPA: hypothetical protein DF613_06360 [Lachnospiraceae bacterium]|nr:hypothetical protein [Lachnospiraceae bacterium]
MNIEFLREFQVLATYLNFTYASNILYVSQPTLSKHIVQLEEELEQTLFIRTKKGVSLTYGGQIFLEAAIDILKIYDHTVADIMALSRRNIGQLDIAFNLYAMDSMFLPMTQTMGEDYPDIQLNLSCPIPIEPVDLLMKDEVDIAETYQIPFPGSEQLVFQNIGLIPFSLAVAAGHPLAKRESVSLTELYKETFVFTKAYPIFNRYIKSYMLAHNIRMPNELTVSNPELMLFTVQNAGAVALISDAELEYNRQDVAFVPVSDKDFYIMVSYAWKKTNRNPCIPAFSEVVKKVFSKNLKTALAKIGI